jgi:uncharacterized protein
MDTYSFRCSACGACCNTPPQMSVPELFHNQSLFVGCLALRRIKRLVPGTQLAFGAQSYVVSSAQVQACADLAGNLLFPSIIPEDTGYDFAITAQGFEYESQGRCPALENHGRCAIYADNKPSACAVVPMDAFLPDTLQHVVLASRETEARYMGASCIAEGFREGYTLVTARHGVIPSSFSEALACRRASLAADKRWWGNAVFQMLRLELFSSPAVSAKIPVDGFFSISFAPVLLVLANISEPCRRRCLEYIEAQLALIEVKVQHALVRKLTQDKPVTQELRAWARTYRRVKDNLESAAASRNLPPVRELEKERRFEIESWLGVISGSGSSSATPVQKHTGSSDLVQIDLGPNHADGEEILAESAKRLRISPEVLRTYLEAGKGLCAPGVNRYFHAVIKPVGSACNLDCTYCYYRSKEKLLQQKSGRIADILLENYIADYITSQDSSEVQFTWHGGEPTLLGLDFFRKVVAFQAKHTPPGRTVSNDLQTNGTLLNDEWCGFLAENKFLVGLSIDGPKQLHDLYRLKNKGGSSFDQAFAASQLLKKQKVRFATLTTVNRRNATRPEDVYRFLRDEVGTTYMQFIPCVEPKQFETTAPGRYSRNSTPEADSAMSRPGHPLSAVTNWSVDPYEWGHFLCAVFDEWARNDAGTVKINPFETIIAQMNGRPAMICATSPFCGKNIAVEQDGRVYACDHYVYPEYQIGKVGDCSLSEMVFSLKQLEFGLNKYNTLPIECRRCRYLSLCGGECPRTRLLRTRNGSGQLSYLCRGWKKFFKHALPLIQRMNFS